MKEEGKKKQVEQEKEEERSWKKQGEEKWKKGGEIEKEEKEEEEEEANWKQGKGKWNQKDEECLTVEQIFELQPVPSWQEQLTFRALVVSFILGIFFSVIVMKLSLTTGIIPSLNIAAGLLSYFMVGLWAKILQRLGFLKQPFTRQENTIVQTCVIASCGISFSGGFGSYLFAMSRRIASQTEKTVNPANVKDPALGWMIGFLFIVSFVGLLVVLPLRKIMIVDHKLIYPSGTATAHLINSFHTPHGAKIVQKQVSVLFKCFACSFFWAFFQWFYTAGEGCGFSSFPTFGLKAYENKFYFDFSATYVGVGMLCPYIVNISLLAGSIISWGIMWPIIESKKGKWYSNKIPLSSFHGLQGYKIFIGTAMILGDGLFQFSSMLTKTIRVISTESRRNESSSTLLPDDDLFYDCSSIGYDEMRRREVFLKDPIPIKYAFAGYFFLATISMIAIPFIFHNLRWYHIMVMYIIAPVFAFSNSYGCGLTDWSVASNYGKLAIMIFGSWVGSHGGVLAGLASCTVLMSIVSSASDLMQDFKTGYLTLASPRAMFISQVVGTAMGCVIAPSIFWIYYKAFPIGVDGSIYPAPYATVNRGLALLSIEGISSLPKHCVKLCVFFFFLSFFFSAFKELMKNSQNRIYYYLPSIMAMAIPFFLGPYFAIDMCVGNIILYLWEKKNLRHAQAFSAVVATGMICGDGIWSLPSSILSLVKVKPPICMRFLSAAENQRASEFLGS